MNLLIRIFLFSFVLILATGCEKVEKLSDESGVYDVNVRAIKPEDVEIGNANIINNKDIVIEIQARKNIFPLTLGINLKKIRDTDKIIGINGDSIQFKNGFDTHEIYSIAPSGVPQKYTIKLSPMDSGADILMAQARNDGGQEITTRINHWNSEVHFIIEKAVFPFRAHLQVYLSPDAKSDISRSIVFKDINTEHSFTVISTNGEKSKKWTFKINYNPQIPNSDFEKWIKKSTFFTKYDDIDPIEPKCGWATANNSFVQGTNPIEYNGGKAAEITTSKQINLLGEFVAAGTLYTGYFEMNLNTDDPRSMTYFGIPFTSKIRSIRLEAKYKAGNKMQQAIKDGNKYKIIDIEDKNTRDCGHIWVELIRYNGTVPLEYHGKPTEGVVVIGKGEMIFDGNNPDYNRWQRIDIPIIYNDDSLPTHIVIVMTSSKEGDVYKGAVGSSLCVDNVELIY